MIVKTLTAWNDLLSGDAPASACHPQCCEMPGGFPILLETEAINGSVMIVGEKENNLATDYYRKRRDDYGNGGFQEWEWDGDYDASAGGDTITDSTVAYSDAPPFTGNVTTTMTTLIDKDAARTAGLADIDAALDWDTMTVDTTTPRWARREHFTPGAGLFRNLASVRYLRFRWRIQNETSTASTKRTTYGKVMWNILFTPAAGSSSWHFLNQSVEFEVTGDPLDPESWVSEWFYLDPPPTPGYYEVRNIRYWNYRSTRLGRKPSYSGTQYPV